MIRVEVPSGEPRERGFRNRNPNAAIGHKRATGRSAMLRSSRDDARSREWSFTMLTKSMLAASVAAE
jgi:hypothetical protein